LSRINLSGLWEGRISGDDEGIAWLNLYKSDLDQSSTVSVYQGCAIFRSYKSKVAIFYEVTIKVDEIQQAILDGELYNIRFVSSLLIQPQEEIFQKNDDIDKPTSGELKNLTVDESCKILSGKWTTRNRHSGQTFNNWVIEGELNLNRCSDEVTNKLPSVTLSWNEFLSWFSEARKQFKQFDIEAPTRLPFIFRGQQTDLWRLKTSFHRTKRSKSLEWFLHDYMPKLANSINSLSSHHFQIEHNWQNAFVSFADKNLSECNTTEKFLFEKSFKEKEYIMWALLSTVQHYGHPTPFLDWTYSPHVAAFFANQSNFLKKGVKTKKRIFAFNQMVWKHFNPIELNLMATQAGIEVKQPIYTSDNQRCMPQQSLFTFSTIAEIESYIEIFEYIGFKEKIFNDHYRILHRFDIEFDDDFLSELSIMGINHASLFPGLEGICKSMAQTYFL
jgi:hypothetical protein